MILRPIYQRIYEHAKLFLMTRNNLVHTRIVLRYALKLLEKVQGEEEVAIPAVLLHDVGWKSVPEELQLTAFGPNPSDPELGKVHEVQGAKIAKKILEGMNYPSGKAKEICRIIRGHDSRKKPISQNDRIVKDADKLFRFSRKGLAIDSERFRVSRNSRLDFLEKQIKDWFFLPLSQQLARKELVRRRKEEIKAKVTRSALLQIRTKCRCVKREEWTPKDRPSKKVVKPEESSLVLTIGHSTRSIEDFVDLLKAHGVKMVVDVRTVPRSRHNPQFNFETLPDTLKLARIEYKHISGLGGLRHPRGDSPNMGWRNSSFRGFADYMLTEEFEKNLKKLIGLAGRKRICLMCAEAVPWRCHRSLIADALQVRGLPVGHITSKNEPRLHKITPFARVDGTQMTYPAQTESQHDTG